MADSDPTPSNDPNDPLQWKRSAKISTYGVICLFSFIANVSASNFTVAILPLEKQFHINSTHVWNHSGHSAQLIASADACR